MDTPTLPDGATESVYTVTEAARLARVSVQALRQRIQRGTVATTRVLRDRRVVLGVSHDELVRAYPELAEAAAVDLERVLSGMPPPERELLEEVEERAHELEGALDRARRVALAARRKLEGEREARARLQGVVADQERRLAELQTERTRLEHRVVDLEGRLLFLDAGGEVPEREPWWARRVVWARFLVAAVVLITIMLSVGSAYGRYLDGRIRAGVRPLESRVEALRGDLTTRAP